jgi:hypothetical protein
VERARESVDAVPVQVAGAGSRGDDDFSSAPRESGNERRKCERRRRCMHGPGAASISIYSLIDKLIFELTPTVLAEHPTTVAVLIEYPTTVIRRGCDNP